MSKPVLFFHVGYPKTATTSIQNTFYSKHRDIFLLDQHFSGTIGRKKFLDFHNDFFCTDSVFFEEFCKKYRFIIDELNSSDKKVLVLSNEMFLTKDEYTIKGKCCPDFGLIADRIYRFFKDSYDIKIIITVREQKTFIPSYFVHFRTGNFDNFINGGLVEPSKGFFGSMFYYDIILFYTKIFGKDNVQVLLYEEYARSKDSFIDKLSNFLGVDANCLDLKDNQKYNVKDKNKGGYTINLYKLLSSLKHNSFLRHINMNNFFMKKCAYLLSFIKVPFVSVHLTDKQKKDIDEIYSENNYKLSKEFGLQLEYYGYSTQEVNGKLSTS